MEISTRDWKLYREKLAKWQEKHMDKLTGEYIDILSSDKPASERFWELEKRIKEDRQSLGVIVKVSKSEMFSQLLDLLNDQIITMDDLSGFSEDLIDTVHHFYKWDKGSENENKKD